MYLKFAVNWMQQWRRHKMPCVTFQANRMFGSIYLNPLGPVHAACFMSRKQQLFLPQVFSG